MPTRVRHPLAAATAFAQAHEAPWTCDPLREPQRFGVHHDDPPPWNRLRSPVHARGLLPDVDRPVVAPLPGIGFDAPHNAAITWRQLLLASGTHQGRALLPADWVRRIAQPTAIAPFYGWLVWLNPEGRLFESASAGAMFMQAAGGHRVWVEPALQAVVVTRWLDAAHQASFIAIAAHAPHGTGA